MVFDAFPNSEGFAIDRTLKLLNCGVMIEHVDADLYGDAEEKELSGHSACAERKYSLTKSQFLRCCLVGSKKSFLLIIMILE